MVKVLRSFVRGPLEPYIAGFAEGLLRQGYSRTSAAQHVCFLAHLDRWMSAEGVGLDGLSGPVIEDYLAQRRAARYAEYRSMKALRPLLDYLAPLGVLPVPAEVRPDAVEELLGRYRDYLLVERGLTAGTVRGYVDFVRPFVATRLRGDVLDLAGMRTADVTGFVLATCPGRAVGSAKLIVCALRSLLRWLHLTGVIATPLAAMVPSVAGWRLSGLPKALEAGQLRRLLAACDRRTPTGRPGLRDHAAAVPVGAARRRGRLPRAGRHRLAPRRDRRCGKGQSCRTTPAARRPGCRDLVIPASRPPRHRRGPDRVRARARTAPGVDDQRGDHGRLRRRAARRPGPDARAPTAAYGRDCDVARGQPAGRGRAGAATPLAAVDCDLRQGRPRRARGAGQAVAGAGHGWCVVTGPLRDELADYLALRRALGYRLARPEKLLGQFLDHLNLLGEARITVKTALDWARLPVGSLNWWAYRLAAVRGFAIYLHGLDPAHEVPAADLLPHRPQRASPYLYSDADIAALITATSTLRTPLRQATFATLIGLLAVTGIRVGEQSRSTAATSIRPRGGC